MIGKLWMVFGLFFENKEHITISNKLTNREKERLSFLYSAKEAITWRDHLRMAIWGNIGIPEVFRLYPKCETVYVNGKRTVF